MVSKRRLSDSFNDVQVRVAPELSERKGLLSGPFGRWLEEELDYQRNMLPGIDNMWLLLTGGENDFNPVWCVRVIAINVLQLCLTQCPFQCKYLYFR